MRKKSSHFRTSSSLNLSLIHICKDLLDLFHRIGAVVLVDKTNRFALSFSYPSVGGHHQYHVTETERKSIGLIHQDNSTDAMEEIKKIFTPEFRNRLDNII